MGNLDESDSDDEIQFTDFKTIEDEIDYQFFAKARYSRRLMSSLDKSAMVGESKNNLDPNSQAFSSDENFENIFKSGES